MANRSVGMVTQPPNFVISVMGAGSSYPWLSLTALE